MENKKGSVRVDYSKEKYQETMIEICRLLSIGLKQSEISKHMKKKGWNYCSVSGVEKMIKHMKNEYNAKTLVHLIVKMKKKNII